MKMALVMPRRAGRTWVSNRDGIWLSSMVGAPPSVVADAPAAEVSAAGCDGWVLAGALPGATSRLARPPIVARPVLGSVGTVFDGGGPATPAATVCSRRSSRDIRLC